MLNFRKDNRTEHHETIITDLFDKGGAMALGEREITGSVSAGGVTFEWQFYWHDTTHPDYDPVGTLYTSLIMGEKKYSPKGEQRTQPSGNTIDRHKLIFRLWDIFREQEYSIPQEVWDARQELERQIMALPDSTL